MKMFKKLAVTLLLSKGALYAMDDAATINRKITEIESELDSLGDLGGFDYDTRKELGELKYQRATLEKATSEGKTVKEVLSADKMEVLKELKSLDNILSPDGYAQMRIRQANSQLSFINTLQ